MLKNCQIFKNQHLALFSNYTKKIHNKNETEQILLELIQNNSNLYIGGYSNYGAPNVLLESLANIRRSSLTLITNVSIKTNVYLRNLLQIDNKVKKIITSLNENQQSYLQNSIELEVINNREFLTRFCYLELFQKRHEYGTSLIKSPLCDVYGNLLWPKGKLQYYNEKFAKNSLHTIAECNDIIENGYDYKESIENFYVSRVVLNNEKDFENKDKKDLNLNLINDLKIQLIIKRLLNELYNDCKVYITENIANLFEKFFMPSHLNIKLLNSYISQNWPFNIEWLTCAASIDLCVIECNQVNSYGEIKCMTESTDQQQFDIANNSSGKLIVIIRELKHDSILNERFSGDILHRKADLIITDKAVFEIDKLNNQINLIEYNEPISELNQLMDCQFKVNYSMIKPMLKF